MSDYFDEHLDTLVGKLDLAQKIRLVTGANFWSTHPEPAIGLRAMVLTDGPSGVRGPVWDDTDPSACLPSPTALAASWDVELAGRMGRLLAAEAARKGVDAVLAPTVNIQRSPLGGRHFECWSEDPQLTSAMAAALVRGLQDHGIAATVKHYVANDAETDRREVDVRVDERTLREVYLAPFEQIVRAAGVWMLMAAYNSVNGVTMTEHDLLTAPLRTEWGFDGVVVSDWRAARSTVESARAGLDLSMPGPGGPWGADLERAVRAGAVGEEHVDAKVRNLLRLAKRVGALGSATVADPRAPLDHDNSGELRDASREGIVLLRNDGALLPLDPARLGRVAVIGELAAQPRIQGGGSAQVRPARVVSLLDGLREALGDRAEVTHVDGYHLDDGLPEVPGRLLHTRNGEAAVTARWLRADGTLLDDERRTSTRLFRLGTDVPAGAAAVELRAKLVADRAGAWELGFIGAGRSTFSVDGRVVSEGSLFPEHDGPGARVLTPPSSHVMAELEAGQVVELVLRHEVSGLGVSVGFGARPPRRSPDAELDAACAAARQADVAVVVVGTSEQIESEGYDRRSLGLPGNQDEVVRRVVAENPRTVVVVNSGAPVLLPWRHEVPSILLSWFGGQEIGNAAADVLLGAAEPGGRLPATWPDHEGDVPVYITTPVEGRLVYDEGVHVGYRAWLRVGAEPAYPFGHGLGYTTWDVSDVRVSDDMTVSADVRNIGERPGKHVLQVYLARPSSTVDRPVRWLAGFAVVRVGAGETAAVEITLPRRAFEHWDTELHQWVLEPGRFEVLIGSSATDIHGTTSVEVLDEPRPARQHSSAVSTNPVDRVSVSGPATSE